MRKKSRILDDLEELYREEFARAQETGDEEAMKKLDFDFRREQLYMEILLDARRLLADLRDGLSAGEDEQDKVAGAEALLERAAKFRRLTRLR